MLVAPGEREQAQSGGKASGRRAQAAGAEGAGDHQAEEAMPGAAGRGDKAKARPGRAPPISRLPGPGDERSGGGGAHAAVQVHQPLFSSDVFLTTIVLFL